MKKHQCEACESHFETNKVYIGDDGIWCHPCHKDLMKQSALDAGIPLSVIEGRTKLSDHFSKEYIKNQYKKGDD